MKLDTKHLRYLTPDDWRVLTAVEVGSKNHEVVPTTLIAQLSNLRSGGSSSGGSKSKNVAGSGRGVGAGGGVHKCISALAKANLIGRTKNAHYDGYRLTYGGLDYLALHTHLKHNTLYSTGPCIGTGKESDIYVCAAPDGSQHVVKIHRLGRISFRSVKNNRDYLRHRSSASWMYMSRLAAQKEFLFMSALREHGFSVPRAIAQNRHTVVMELVDGVPLRSVKHVGDPAGLYGELIEVIIRLAQHGLIHGDFNEFNIMICDEHAPSNRKEDEEGKGESDNKTKNSNANNTDTDTNTEASPKPEDIEATARMKIVIIDFPQMVSIDHADAEMYFDRDVNCIKTFFQRRFNFLSDQPGPYLADVVRDHQQEQRHQQQQQILQNDSTINDKGRRRLDVQVEASGFSKKMAKELERYMQDVGAGEDLEREDVSEDAESFESEEEFDEDREERLTEESRSDVR